MAGFLASVMKLYLSNRLINCMNTLSGARGGLFYPCVQSVGDLDISVRKYSAQGSKRAPLIYSTLARLLLCFSLKAAQGLMGTRSRKHKCPSLSFCEKAQKKSQQNLLFQCKNLLFLPFDNQAIIHRLVVLLFWKLVQTRARSKDWVAGLNSGPALTPGEFE